MVHPYANGVERLEYQFHVHPSGLCSVWVFLDRQNPEGLVTGLCLSKCQSPAIASGFLQDQSC